MKVIRLGIKTSKSFIVNKLLSVPTPDRYVTDEEKLIHTTQFMRKSGLGPPNIYDRIAVGETDFQLYDLLIIYSKLVFGHEKIKIAYPPTFKINALYSKMFVDLVFEDDELRLLKLKEPLRYKEYTSIGHELSSHEVVNYVT